ncbi:hypothetical protein [Alloactinosynnema sp. L-07]|nr:hypothetical protein [Alloactinosynnema sp. L-07]
MLHLVFLSILTRVPWHRFFADVSLDGHPDLTRSALAGSIV